MVQLLSSKLPHFIFHTIPLGDDAPTKFPPAPSLAPVVSHEMPSPLWKSWLHHTDFGAAALEASSRNSSALNKSYSTTAYLVKLSTSSQNFYIWQVEISTEYKFSAKTKISGETILIQFLNSYFCHCLYIERHYKATGPISICMHYSLHILCCGFQVPNAVSQ